MRTFPLIAVVLLGCGQGPTTTCKLALTGSYPSTTFMAATTNERTLNEQAERLVAALDGPGLQPPVRTTRDALDALWTTGSTSLVSVTAPAFSAQMNDVFTAFIASQDKMWTPANPPLGGGLYGKYVFSERGVDLSELVEKGLFGALALNEAIKRMPTATTPESIDQLVALYGATPTFPQDEKAPEGKDTLTAKYAKRRTPPGMSGSYTIIRDAFMTARAAATSPNCSAERAQALETVRQEWERVLASTSFFYINATVSKLQDANADAAKKAAAMHDLGEAVGLLHGLRAVPSASRKITDAQLDALIAGVKAPALATTTAFRLLTDVPPELDGLSMANTQLATIYGFSADDVVRFRASY
jgi:hypothetical protein